MLNMIRAAVTKGWEYAFYICYISHGDDDSEPSARLESACLSVTFIQCVNIYTVLFAGMLELKVAGIHISRVVSVYLVPIALAIAVYYGNYFYFSVEGRVAEITRKFGGGAGNIPV